MHAGKLVFAQLMDHLPLHTFRRCVAKYPSRYPTLSFSHLDQFLCMAFAQLTYRESLRDIETCLRAHSTKLYHLGIRGGIARSTLADANETRDWRIVGLLGFTGYYWLLVLATLVVLAGYLLLRAAAVPVPIPIEGRVGFGNRLAAVANTLGLYVRMFFWPVEHHAKFPANRHPGFEPRSPRCSHFGPGGTAYSAGRSPSFRRLGHGMVARPYGPHSPCGRPRKYD